jgi:hypothetical protein
VKLRAFVRSDRCQLYSCYKVKLCLIHVRIRKVIRICTSFEAVKFFKNLLIIDTWSWLQIFRTTHLQSSCCSCDVRACFLICAGTDWVAAICFCAVGSVFYAYSEAYRSVFAILYTLFILVVLMCLVMPETSCHPVVIGDDWLGVVFVGALLAR